MHNGVVEQLRRGRRRSIRMARGGRQFCDQALAVRVNSVRSITWEAKLATAFLQSSPQCLVFHSKAAPDWTATDRFEPLNLLCAVHKGMGETGHGYFTK
jgi:hypothetical protein